MMRIKGQDLFDWAESQAARRGRRLEDFAAVSIRAVPVVCLALAGWWQQSPEDSYLRSALATATIFTLVLTFVAWGTRAYQSSIDRKGVAIVLYISSLVGTALALCIVVGIFLHDDLNRNADRRAEAAKVRAELEAARAAAAMVQQQARRAQEAAARALAAKNEAAREAERAVMRIAEAECLRVRDDAIDKAAKAHASARKSVADCRAEYDQKLFPFKSFRENCKVALSRLVSARAQLREAKAKECGTDITGSIDKPK